jgi:hypothetical protein
MGSSHLSFQMGLGLGIREKPKSIMQSEAIVALWVRREPKLTVKLSDGRTVRKLDDNEYYAGLVLDADGNPMANRVCAIKFAIRRVDETALVVERGQRT